MIQRCVSVIAALVLLSSAAQADLQVVAALDKDEGGLEDTFYLTIQVSGKSVAQPEIPAVEGLRIEPTGKSEKIQMINGTVTRQIEFNYMLEPKRAGTYTIPAIAVRAGGESRSTTPLTLRVEARTAANADAVGKDVSLMAELSATRAFVGQQLLYTLKFFRRVNTTNAELGEPKFDGFNAERLGEPKSAERVINGQRFQVTEIRFALFPNQPGERIVDSATVRFDTIQVDPRDPFARFGFMSAGRRVQGRVVSPERKVHVMALPEAGRPSDFSGLIGKFQLNASLSPERLSVGQSTNLTISVSGRGNVRQMPEPQWSNRSELEKQFKIYDDKPALKVSVGEGGLSGEKVSKKALVALKAGDFSIPPMTLSYFDPETQRYERLSTTSFQIHVDVASHPETAVVVGANSGTPKQRVEVLGEDLMPLETKLAALTSQSISPWEKAAGVLAVGASPLIFAAGFLMQRGRQHWQRNIGEAQRRGALKKARRALMHAKKATKSREVYHELGRVVRGYLGDKLGVNGLALTPSEAAVLALEHGCDSATGKQLKDLLGRCESQQYGGSSDKAAIAETLWSDVEEILSTLDRSLKGKSK